MRRIAAALLSALFLVGLVAPAAGVAPTVAAAGPVPKVVLIVGPAGGATDRYRAEARAAAALARKYTPDVTEVYSPNATWPAVKSALQGASLVIYMGHGNGWPSPYRDSLYPPTQNGFGLNPKSGGGDSTHQYFGEASIAKSIRLADDAVVLLNHLCYASGNSEPGLAEGTLDQARQRVENFAAGFIKAGAAAVIAEAYASPNHMVKAVLGGGTSIEAAWKAAPSRNGHAFAFESSRNRGYVAQMDPEKADSGFTRSIVLKAGLAPADVLRGARGSASAAARGGSSSLAPSLVAAGIAVKVPSLTSTAAGSSITYKVPYSVEHRKELPKSMKASVRWDRLDPVAPDPLAAAAAAGAASAVDPNAVPDLGLVSAERPGDVVDPVKVKLAKKSFTFKVETPEDPGRYRLTVTLHDADGVAFDASTQALLPALIVRVTGDLDAEIVAAAASEVTRGAVTNLSLWIGNVGSVAWGHEAFIDPIDPEGSTPAVAARLTAQWVALGGPEAIDQIASAAAAAAEPVDLPPGMAPGAVVSVGLPLSAPVVPGDYLLILDILTPERGSLVANGVEVTIVRVKVVDPEPGGAVQRTSGKTAGPSTGLDVPVDSGAPAESPVASEAPAESPVASEAPAVTPDAAPEIAPAR
ncbi:MAG: hypothetical protein OEV61_01785 [Chloroflexota bacterium]|nr:hypothetical protein [Chloroflexota bacterium]MDH5242337.1 hypothetical protein [Chloroflexota bacterium]